MQIWKMKKDTKCQEINLPRGARALLTKPWKRVSKKLKVFFFFLKSSCKCVATSRHFLLNCSFWDKVCSKVCTTSWLISSTSKKLLSTKQKTSATFVLYQLQSWALKCLRVGSCWVTIANSFSHHTSVPKALEKKRTAGVMRKRTRKCYLAKFRFKLSPSHDFFFFVQVARNSVGKHDCHDACCIFLRVQKTFYTIV